jgi:hypothetical protein
MTVTGLLSRAAGVAAALPLATGVLLLAASAASAAPTAPGDGTVFTSYSTFTITADYGGSTAENRLTLAAPGGDAVVVASAPGSVGGGTLSYRLDTGCWTYPSSSCSGRRLAPNGTWTVSQSGGGSGSSTFVTRIRPEAPTSVSATVLNPREVRVSWRLGAEPDLTGWTVFDGGSVARDGIGRGACGSGTCSTVVSYATEGSGEHVYTVKAFRATAPGSTVTLESPLSAPVSARLEAAPSPQPAETAASEGGSSEGGSTEGGSTEGGSTGGGSTEGGSSAPTAGGTPSSGGSGSGASSSGGSTSGDGRTAPIGTSTASAGTTADQKAVAQRKAFALGFSAFGPKLGIPKLPPLPQAPAPAIAPELADGTFAPTLGFEEQVFTEQVETTAASPARRARTVVGSALDSERLLRSSAAALVLLLAGAHLRRWLGTAHEE